MEERNLYMASVGTLLCKLWWLRLQCAVGVLFRRSLHSNSQIFIIISHEYRLFLDHRNISRQGRSLRKNLAAISYTAAFFWTLKDLILSLEVMWFLLEQPWRFLHQWSFCRYWKMKSYRLSAFCCLRIIIGGFWGFFICAYHVGCIPIVLFFQYHVFQYKC